MSRLHRRFSRLRSAGQLAVGVLFVVGMLAFTLWSVARLGSHP